MKTIALIIAAALAMGGLPVDAEASLAGSVAKAAVKRGSPAKAAASSMTGKHTASSAVKGKPRDLNLMFAKEAARDAATPAVLDADEVV